MAHEFPRPSQSLGEPLTIIRGQVSQTVVDAFTEEEITLPSNPANNIGFLVRRVIFRPSVSDFALIAANTSEQAFIEWSLSTRQGAADMDAVGLDQEGTIATGIIVYQLVSGAVEDALAVHVLGAEWDYSVGGLLTSTRKVSLYMDSDRMNLVDNVKMILLGHIVEVTATELVAALSTEVGI